VLARLRFQLQPTHDPRREHVLRPPCVWELYVFFSTSGARALKRVELYDFSDRGTSTLLDFEVANAHCFSPDDEAKLRSIIESGGASDFNDMIREGVNTACTLLAPFFERLNCMLCLRHKHTKTVGVFELYGWLHSGT